MDTKITGTMSGAEMVALSKQHTLFEWAVQGPLDPIPVAKAKGIYFWTPEGKRFIDFNSMLMSVNIGHGDERIIKAIQDQVATLAYVNPSMVTEPRARLGAKLAELTGIPVVADFRSRDVAAGGQGAPLVPAFHAQVFSLAGAPRAVLNLGGIGNLTLLPAESDPTGQVRGFDCGPGNALLDHWVARHRGHAFDDEGRWAAGGRVHPSLLATLLAEPFLQRSPPKSTGRDLFNPEWLAARLAAHAEVPAQDVQATLADFTAHTYRLIGTHPEPLPASFRPVFERMAADDWMAGYRDAARVGTEL